MAPRKKQDENGLSDLENIYCPACTQLGRVTFLGKSRILKGEVYIYCRRCKNWVGVSAERVAAVPGLGIDKSTKTQ